MRLEITFAQGDKLQWAGETYDIAQSAEGQIELISMDGRRLIVSQRELIEISMSGAHLVSAATARPLVRENRQIPQHYQQNTTVRRRKWQSRRKMARNIGKLPSKKAVYLFRSWKMKFMHACESAHEYFHLMLLDTDPTVVEYFVQPIRLSIKPKTGFPSFDHIPDVEVLRTNGSRSYLEVKTDDDAARLPQARLDAINEHLIGTGFGYEIVLKSRIYSEPRLKNAMELHYYCDDRPSTIEKEMIIDAVKRMHPSGVMIGDLQCEFKQVPKFKEKILSMLCRAELLFDCNQPLSEATLIFSQEDANA